MANKVNHDRPIVNFIDLKIVPNLLAPTNLMVYRKEKKVKFRDQAKHLYISLWMIDRFYTIQEGMSGVRGGEVR